MTTLKMLFVICQLGWIACMIAGGQLYGWGAFALIFGASVLAIAGVTFNEHIHGYDRKRP